MSASVLAWAGAIAIGVSLGLFGSGGSILTVPVLVFLFGQDQKVAIAGSLAVVGIIAAVGAAGHLRARRVDWYQVLWFGVPGMAGTYVGAWCAQFVSGALQLTVFCLVMLSAAVLMFRPPDLAGAHRATQSRTVVIAEGLIVGIVTGFVGVGGGFLVVPALVLLGGLPMHRAVATSLVIIALKSFSGFYKYLDVLDLEGLRLDWSVIALVSALGVGGTFLGSHIGNRVPQRALQRGFAAFLVVMAGYILWRTVPDLL